MLIKSLLFLYCGSIFGQDVPVTPGRQEIQINIIAKKPGLVITEISDAIYMFLPNTDTDGIAISCFPRLLFFSEIPSFLKNCTVFLDSDKNKAITDLYELSTSQFNTRIFDSTVGINCRGVNTTDMGIVVQDARYIRQFNGRYSMIDLDVKNAQGLLTYSSKGGKLSFTTVSFNGALIRLVSAHFLSDQKYFKITDSTPEKPSTDLISEKNVLPHTVITANTLFTTFLFEDADVLLQIQSDLETKVCDNSKSVIQMNNTFYIYPEENQMSQATFSGDLFCGWNFIAFDAYYVQFTLMGYLESSSQIDIRDERGTGVFFSSDYSTSTDYKGSILNNSVYSLPSSGSLVFKSFLGMGSFSFKAEFLLFDANKPVETRVLGANDSSYLINMNVLQSKQFFFDTSHAFLTFELGIYAAPTYIHRSYIQVLDTCFVETNDAKGNVERYSLRSSFECGQPRMFKSALVSCLGDDVLDGYLLVNGFENLSMTVVGEACARMASSLKSFIITGNNPAHNQFTALMVIEDDSVDTVSLISMRKNGTDSLLIINGGIFGEQIANITDNAELPFYTQKKLVTYRMPSSSAAILNFTVFQLSPVPIDNHSKSVATPLIFSLLLCSNALMLMKSLVLMAM